MKMPPLSFRSEGPSQNKKSDKALLEKTVSNVFTEQNEEVFGRVVGTPLKPLEASKYMVGRHTTL